jgi:transcription elongation factor GreA
MDIEKEYITAEKKAELELELKDLKGPKRREILDALEFAKSLGDLSENAEYHQAREEQGKLEERIAKIEHLLLNSTLIKKHHSNQVEVGATVTVQKVGTKDSKVFEVVGSEEADTTVGKISNRSPLGMALFGGKKGDTVSFMSPSGEVKYTIVDIA